MQKHSCKKGQWLVSHASCTCAALQLGRVQAQPSWVTCLAWTSVTADSASHSSPEHMLLASGCCDGSVRLLSIAVSSLSQQSSSGEALPAVHCGTVQPPDLLNVHCLAAGWLAEASGEANSAVQELHKWL